MCMMMMMWMMMWGPDVCAWEVLCVVNDVPADMCRGKVLGADVC